MFETILSLIIGTPWWVFVLFGFLLFVGLKASKPRTVPLAQLFILPIVLNVWSLINFSKNSATLFPALLWWIVMLVGGLMIGFFIHSKRTIIIDRQAMTVRLPGSWMPLVLIMSIFIVKYYFGYACATADSLHECSLYHLYNSYFSAFASGIFLGNAAHIAYEFYRVNNK